MTAALPDSIVGLPDGFKPEGIASDGHTGFFVCSIRGWVLHHNLETNISTKVTGSDVVLPLLALTGLKYCPVQNALFLSSALNSKGYIFYLSKNEAGFSVEKRVELLFPRGSYINDVVLGNNTVFFTDSWLPRLYSIPRYGDPDGKWSMRAYNLGPQMKFPPPLLASNGLAVLEEGPNRTVLVVAHWGASALYHVEIKNGLAKTEKIGLPVRVSGKKSGYDGIIKQGTHTLFVGDNLNDRVVRFQLAPDFRSAKVTCMISSKNFDGTGTVTLQQGRLLVTNMRFKACFLLDPCPTVPFSVVGVDVDSYCSPA